MDGFKITPRIVTPKYHFPKKQPFREKTDSKNNFQVLGEDCWGDINIRIMNLLRRFEVGY